ncbi:DUF6858 family protein [Thiorhodococcus minor]|uniref:DUF6858 family protein n=1 Tax=Thiorhodococcus minor TaxID=57489 RepID=UPI003158CB4B
MIAARRRSHVALLQGCAAPGQPTGRPDDRRPRRRPESSTKTKLSAGCWWLAALSRLKDLDGVIHDLKERIDRHPHRPLDRDLRSLRPRSIRVAGQADPFVLSDLEAPMPLANQAMASRAHVARGCRAAGPGGDGVSTARPSPRWRCEIDCRRMLNGRCTPVISAYPFSSATSKPRSDPYPHPPPCPGRRLSPGLLARRPADSHLCQSRTDGPHAGRARSRGSCARVPAAGAGRRG